MLVNCDRLPSSMSVHGTEFIVKVDTQNMVTIKSWDGPRSKLWLWISYLFNLSDSNI